MHPSSIAQRAVGRHGECGSLDAASAARLFAYWPVTLSRIHGRNIAHQTRAAHHRPTRASASAGRESAVMDRTLGRGVCDRQSPVQADDCGDARDARVGHANPARPCRSSARKGAMVVTDRITPQRRREPGPLITSG